jgi:hypothetical protein
VRDRLVAAGAGLPVALYALDRHLQSPAGGMGVQGLPDRRLGSLLGGRPRLCITGSSTPVSVRHNRSSPLHAGLDAQSARTVCPSSIGQSPPLSIAMRNLLQFDSGAMRLGPC